MKSLFFKKIVLFITIVSFVFGSFGNVFTPKALAQQGPTTPGEAAGQALAAGVACLLSTKLDMKVQGAIDGISAWLGGAVTSAAGGVVTSVVGGITGAANEVPVKAKGVEQTIQETSKKVVANQQTVEAVSLSKKCIRDVVVKMMLDWIVDETIGWIQGEGQPRYVTNWDTFLSDAFNVGAGEIAKEVGLAWLCKPFGLQVRLTLLPVSRFQNRISCTLDDIIANIEDFYNDFENGGWIAYNQVWNPENNYYGQISMIHDEMLSAGLKQREVAIKETEQGFRPDKKCISYAIDANDRLKRGEIKKLEDACLEWEIITPASVAANLTYKVAAADIDWVVNVDSWVTALTNAVINRVIKEGIGLMKKSTEPQTSGGGNYDPYGGYDPALSLKRQERDRIKNDYQTFIVYFNTILANKKSSLSSEQQILVASNELKTRNCQPPVSDSNITNAQAEITRLVNEVASYQAIVNETQAGITEANNISADFRDREMALLTQHFNDFLTKYQSLISEIAPGPETTKKASEDESRNKQNELASNQSRLSLCIATTP